MSARIRVWQVYFAVCAGACGLGMDAYANDTTADPQASALKGQPLEVAPYGAVPAKAWRVHTRLYNDTKEAQLGFA